MQTLIKQLNDKWHQDREPLQVHKIVIASIEGVLPQTGSALHELNSNLHNYPVNLVLSSHFTGKFLNF